jgi:hypothetical protein
LAKSASGAGSVYTNYYTNTSRTPANNEELTKCVFGRFAGHS